MSLSLQDSLRQTAGLFRLGQEAKASVELRLCLDKIEKTAQNLSLIRLFSKYCLLCFRHKSNTIG